MKLIARKINPEVAKSLEQAGEHPLLARLFSSRGVEHAQELDLSLRHLIPPTHLKGNAQEDLHCCRLRLRWRNGLCCSDDRA
jgi:single-stranded-DNA-specific exonuclease